MAPPKVLDVDSVGWNKNNKTLTFVFGARW